MLRTTAIKRKRLTAALVELRSSIQDLTGDDGAISLTDEALLELLQTSGAARRAFDGVLIDATSEVTRRSASPDRSERMTTQLGCRNEAELLQRTLGVNAGTAKRFVSAGKAVMQNVDLYGELYPAPLPIVREAVLDGTLGLDGVLAVAPALMEAAKRADVDDVRLAEAHVVAHAR